MVVVLIGSSFGCCTVLELLLLPTVDPSDVTWSWTGTFAVKSHSILNSSVGVVDLFQAVPFGSR